MRFFKVYHFKLKRAALFLFLALLPTFVFSLAFNGFSENGFENFYKKCYADEITDALPSAESGETGESDKEEEAETALAGESAEEMRRAIEEFCDQLDLSALDEFYKNESKRFLIIKIDQKQAIKTHNIMSFIENYGKEKTEKEKKEKENNNKKYIFIYSLPEF